MSTFCLSVVLEVLPLTRKREGLDPTVGAGGPAGQGHHVAERAGLGPHLADGALRRGGA